MQAATRSSFAGSAVAARPAAAARAARGQGVVRAGINAHKENKFTEELQATAKYISQVRGGRRGAGGRARRRAGAQAGWRPPTAFSALCHAQRGRGILASDESNATTGAHSCLCVLFLACECVGRMPGSSSRLS